jgi:hypothetical protein
MVARLPSPSLVPLAANAARPGESGVDPAGVPDLITAGVPSLDPDGDGDTDVPVPYNTTAPAAVVSVPASTQKQPGTSVPANADLWTRTPSAGSA